MQVRFGAQYGIHYDQAIPKPLQEKLTQRLHAAILYRPDRRYVMDNTFREIQIRVRPYPHSGVPQTADLMWDMLDISAQLKERISRNTLDPHVNQPPNGDGSDCHVLHMTAPVDLVRQGGGGGDMLSMGALTENTPTSLRLLDRVVDNLLGNILMLDAAFRGAQRVVQTPASPTPYDAMPSINA